MVGGFTEPAGSRVGLGALLLGCHEGGRLRYAGSGRGRSRSQSDFTEWTRDGMLRHPRFLGLRDDKAAEDVVRERPADGAAA